MPCAPVRRACVVLTALVSLFTAPAYAQQTGSIAGKVTATDGALLPGVSVVAKSDVLPAPRETVTGSEGAYRLPALPPGTYTITFALSGMQAVTRQAQVQLGSETIADAVLGVGGVTEAVTVTAQASIVNPESAAIKNGLTNQQISSLPVGQEYRDLLKLIPGVQYLAGHHARAERRRQRAGQRVPVRRRQRDAAALRHAVGRAGLVRHRRLLGRQGRRARGGLRPVGRLLGGLGQPLGHQPLRRPGQLPVPDERHGGEAERRQPVAVFAEPRLDHGEPRRADREGPPVLLRLVLPPAQLARQPGEPVRRPAEVREHAQRGLRQDHLHADQLGARQPQLPPVAPSRHERPVPLGLLVHDGHGRRGLAEDRHRRGVLGHQRAQPPQLQVHPLREPDAGPARQRVERRDLDGRRHAAAPVLARHERPAGGPAADRR